MYKRKMEKEGESTEKAGEGGGEERQRKMGEGAAAGAKGGRWDRQITRCLPESERIGREAETRRVF